MRTDNLDFLREVVPIISQIKKGGADTMIKKLLLNKTGSGFVKGKFLVDILPEMQFLTEPSTQNGLFDQATHLIMNQVLFPLILLVVVIGILIIIWNWIKRK